jgi:hypothetical protein
VPLKQSDEQITAAIAAEIERAFRKLGASTLLASSICHYGTQSIVEVMGKLGAGEDLLDIVASYGDTMDKKRVLGELRRWNHRTRPARRKRKPCTSQ